MDSYIAMDLLAFACALTAAAFMAWQHPEHQQTQRMAWVFLILLLLPILIQLLWLDLRNPWKAVQMAMYISSAWLVFRMAQGYAAELLEKQSWFILLAIMGNAYALFATLVTFVPQPDFVASLFPIWTGQGARFGGVFMQANMQSLFLSIICIGLWARAISTERYIPWLLASLLPCAGVFATSSRSSALVLLIGVLALLFLCQQRKVASIKLLVVIALAFGLSEYWLSFAQHMPGYDHNLLQRFESSGTQARLFIWDMVWRLFIEQPWFGIGAGNLISYGTEGQIATLAAHPEWSSIADGFSGGHAWAHNLVLQFFCEWGIFGGLAITGLVIGVFYRAWRILFIYKTELTSGSAQAAFGATLMLMHGMVSISMMQGFFLALFALYAAALFPVSQRQTCSKQSTTAQHKAQYLLLLLLPAVFMFYQWQLFINKELAIERVINLPVKSEAFIAGASEAITSPWSARPALQLYFSSLLAEHAKPGILIGSENFAYRFWFLHQSSLSLRYLILIAHLKDDVLSEQRLINTYRLAYPALFQRSPLARHTAARHQQGESIDLNN
ncbi:MAG: O-antigen ligase family protein [Mariprofundus sp.]|nr:O-antigen ligase family protein [Mariprofundus sp.]